MSVYEKVGDWPLLGIVVSFIAWEVYAHYFAHNHGSHTLSDDVGRFEKWAGWPADVTVAVVCVVLLVHLIHERIVAKV